MAEQILDYARDIIEGQIDFEGQKLAEYVYTALLSLAGVVAFLVGFYTKNVYNTLYVGLAGTAVTFLIVVPHWPFYNKHPARFLPSQRYKGTVNVSVDVDGKKIS